MNKNDGGGLFNFISHVYFLQTSLRISINSLKRLSIFWDKLLDTNWNNSSCSASLPIYIRLIPTAWTVFIVMFGYIYFYILYL